jgi:hypothetical protein
MATYVSFCDERGLRPPESLAPVLSDGTVRDRLGNLIYWSGAPSSRQNSLDWGLSLLADAVMPAPPSLLPLLPVDDASIACVVCLPLEVEPCEQELFEVVRWHLGKIDPELQGASLDKDAVAYLKSVAEELGDRAAILDKIRKEAGTYYKTHVEAEVTPRGHELRPVQLACQNVILGLATLQHDASFDGLRVVNYATCEASHVATHEANRAMAALLLCDAFHNGGTMELRFGRRGGKEAVPPALARFGRTLGLDLGANGSSISPEEARQLFLAATPMSDDLRSRSFDLFDRGIISPERLCYALMSGAWKPIELDYILGTSSRSPSILRGGASFETRSARLAESETCRSALMAGMYQRRLDNADAPAKSGKSVRVFEDSVAGVSWAVLEDAGAMLLANIPLGPPPWSARKVDLSSEHDASIIVVPRGLPLPGDYETVQALQSEFPDTLCALLVPVDMIDVVPPDLTVLVCPERLGELDGEIERRLAACRTGRS